MFSESKEKNDKGLLKEHRSLAGVALLAEHRSMYQEVANSILG